MFMALSRASWVLGIVLLSVSFFAESSSSAKPVDHLMGYNTHKTEINGITQVYIDQGEGPVMLFLHGYPFFSAGWQPLLDRFEKTHRVIAPDNRGFGFTDKPQAVNEYHISRLVKDVEALVQKVSPDRPIVLVGHDWGGALAWAVAQSHPKLIEKVIVINAPPHNVLLHMLKTNQVQQKASRYIEILKTDKVEAAFKTRGAEMLWRYGFHRMLANGHITEEYKSAFFSAWSDTEAMRGAMNWYRANIPRIEDITDELYWPSKNARVTVPSLLITSENERTFTRETFEKIANIADDYTMKVIPEAGHTPFFEKPNEVENIIREFLSKGSR